PGRQYLRAWIHGVRAIRVGGHGLRGKGERPLQGRGTGARLFQSAGGPAQPAGRDQQAAVHGRGHIAEDRGFCGPAEEPLRAAAGNQGIHMKKHSIEISPPDIAPYRNGNTGVDYVHVLDSGKPGPNVMVQALTHGNEYCGALALDYFFKSGIKPIQGKLILAFANTDAFARFDFDNPDRSRYIDEDYNRVWGDDALLGSRDSAELRRARELRPFVD